MSAVAVAAAELAGAGFPELATEITGGDDYVVRPRRPLLPFEAMAFLKARRVAYVTVGLTPCHASGCGRECEHPDDTCFADGEDWHASQMRLLTSR